MPFHTVQQGETLLGLASKNGLDSWEDIVNAPENASIKDSLKDPGVVKGGISLFSPNRVLKQDPKGVDSTHPFTVTLNEYLEPAAELMDFVCLENDKAGPSSSGSKTITNHEEHGENISSVLSYLRGSRVARGRVFVVVLADQQGEDGRQQREDERLDQADHQLQQVERDLHEPSNRRNARHRVEHRFAREDVAVEPEAQ